MGVCLDRILLGAAGAGITAGIEALSDVIKTMVNTARKPMTPIPPFYTSIEGMMRPGISPISLTSNIISRLGEV